MSHTYSIPTWAEENRSLHDAICQARVNVEAADELKHQLQMNKERFINLLDNVPKNSSHRATLNSNKAYIDRTAHNVSKEFVTKALFLSDQLDINEYVAATLLMRGTTEATRVSSNALDTAVLLYHGERGYLLACLDVILNSAKDSSVSNEVRSVCYEFMEEIMKQSISAKNNTSITFIQKIISTLESLSNTILSIQNTGSVIGHVPEAGSGKLGEDISELRIERLGDERIYIVQILYHIASLFDIRTEDKVAMLKLLEEAELSDPATAYVITAMLAALSSENQTIEESPSPENLEFIQTFHNRIMTHGSKVPVIKAVIVLQWVLYLSDPVRASKVISSEYLNRSDADIQKLLELSFDADVFRFMNEYLLYFKQPNASIDTNRKVIKYDSSTDARSAKKVDKADYHNYNADIRIDFHPFVIYELEKLGVAVIQVQFHYLQQLKYKEEDTYTPVQAPLTTENALISSSESNKQCHDVEYFLTFLASIYRDRANAGVIFWDKEQTGLNNFTRWLLDIKIVSTVCAAFDFLGSIATGDACATHMFQFFMNGVTAELGDSALFSWGKPFSALTFYANLLKSNSEETNAIIPTIEEELIMKFLIILKQTVQYSKEARFTFWYSNIIQVQYTLIDILSCPTSTQLRAALFDVLSAFSSAWGGGVDGVGSEISLQVWRFLEDSDMLLPKHKSVQLEKDKSQVVSKPAGILQELESEKASRVYTETLAVIRLIGSIIHTQSKREQLVSGFKATQLSIPIDLGKNTKNPGATPFISLIVDDIFVIIPNQKYAFAEAQWELSEACLLVMENSIEAFNLERLEEEHIQAELNRNLQLASPIPSIQNDLLAYLTHPGFQVIIRILSGGRVINEIFTIIEECAKRETKEVENLPYHKKCLLRALRILLKVLDLQTTFCKILLPYIIGFSKRNASSEFQLGDYTFAPLPSVVPLGQLMLFNSEVLERIALLINYGDQEEICFLSTKILNRLSVDKKESSVTTDQVMMLSHVTSSPALYGLGSNLTSVLSTSRSADAIIFGVSERLSINIPETTTCDDYEFDTNNIPFWLAKETLENTYNETSDYQPRVSSSVRLAILDLLLDNAKQDNSSTTMAEFLLGYDLTNRNPLNRIQDTEENKATLVCFHTILDMMRQGIEKHYYLADSMIEDNVDPTLPLIDTHPILAEKCYELIYRLCAKQSLSVSTMRYLRNRENFFYKQFDRISSRIEYNIQMESPSFPGTMICADGTQHKTDFFRLRSKLHQRAWILQCIALELHTTIGMEQKNEARKLIELLYGRKNIFADDDMDAQDQLDNGIFSVSQSFQQPLAKMLEFVSSLEFTWVDQLTLNLKVSELVHLNGFDVKSYEIINERGCQIYDVRNIYKDLRTTQEIHFINTPDNDAVETEMGSILNWCMAQNHLKEITFAKIHCLKAWKEVIHVTIIECFDLIGVEHRENMVYELLNMLLNKIMQTKEYDGNMLKSMSEVITSLINRLRKDKKSRPASQLPIEKLKLIFNGIVNCIRLDDTTFEVRGDMYSAMTSFLLYINGHGKDDSYVQLESYIVDHISCQNSKLLEIICVDASRGLEIWKTTAYIGLDGLNKAALRAGSDIVQCYLIQNNFLQYTIEMIKSDDAALINLLEQTDAALLPLYIFEAKMSILLSLAMNPEGAELLFRNRIFEVLGQCQFMKAQQQDYITTQTNVGHSEELAERYQQLLMPTLKLVVAILCSYRGENETVLERAERWVEKQQATLVNILKEDKRQLTKNSLERIKLVGTIMCFISSHKQYSDDFANKGINQIHNAMLQFDVADIITSSITPITGQDSVSGNNNTAFQAN
ncbi:hypothetical protein INT47_008407, partial [Mucor saturninus]